MAAIVVAKAALETNKNVNKYIPGGWITVLASILVIIVIVPILVFQAVASGVAPFLKGGYQEVCATASVNGDSGSKGGDPIVGGILSQYSTIATPWPSEDSANVSFPAPNPVMTSGFGPRAPIMTSAGLTPGFHNGQDFGQAQGSPVLSIADGIVATAANGGSPYGSHVAVKHTVNGEHYTSVYGHVIGASITVKVGDTVKAGQQIASVGTEGLSTAPHIHLTLTRGDYSPSASEPFGTGGGPGNSIDAGVFLNTNGAKTASGGLTGTEFNGVSSDEDTLCKDGSAGLEGDGFSSWGGFENGQIDGTSAISFAPQFSLMSRAASDLSALNKQYKARFGKDIAIEIAYRDGTNQALLYETGSQLEPVGSSMYGWARAIKITMAFDTSEYSWMTANAPKMGWDQTSTYKKGGTAANAGIWGYKGNGENGDIPVAANANAEESRATAKKILEEDHGWGAAEYTCLVKLWEHESNWNYKAENPSSGAYGIVQALPPSKMNTVGTDWRTNAATQIKWGLIYIEDRYGTPCGAWSFWQETDPAKKSGYPGNWY